MASTETKTSIIIFNPEEGFLRVVAKPNTEIELSDAKHDFFVSAELINKIRIPVLADSRNVTNSDKEVRDFYASREMAENISAMAVLVASLSTRIVGNFFIKTSKPHFPTKLFTSESAAIVWINEILKKEAEEKNSKVLSL